MYAWPDLVMCSEVRGVVNNNVDPPLVTSQSHCGVPTSICTAVSQSPTIHKYYCRNTRTCNAKCRAVMHHTGSPNLWFSLNGAALQQCCSGILGNERFYRELDWWVFFKTTFQLQFLFALSTLQRRQMMRLNNTQGGEIDLETVGHDGIGIIYTDM